MTKKIIEILNAYIPPSGAGTSRNLIGNYREILKQLQDHLLEMNYKHEKRGFSDEIDNLLDKQNLGEIMYSYYQESNLDRLSALQNEGLKIKQYEMDQLFMFSAHHDNLETVQFLSSLCSNISTTNNWWNRSSALCLAVYQGPPSVVQFLLDEKADVNAYSDPIQTYPSYAVSSTFLKTNFRVKPEPLIHYAFRRGRDDIVKLLLDSKVTPDPDSPDAKQLLSESISEGRIGITLALFDAKLAPNPDSRAFKDLLFLSVDHKLKEIMHAFLNAKAALNPNSPYSIELLCESIAKEHIDIMRALLDAKADPNLWDPTTKSKALELAIRLKRYDTGAILVEACVGVNWWEPQQELMSCRKLAEFPTPLRQLELDRSPLSEPKNKLIKLLERDDPDVAFRNFMDMERNKANNEFLESLDNLIKISRDLDAKDILMHRPEVFNKYLTDTTKVMNLLRDLLKDSSTSTMSKWDLVRFMQNKSMELYYKELASKTPNPQLHPEQASCAQAPEDSSAHEATPASAAAASDTPPIELAGLDSLS